MFGNNPKSIINLCKVPITPIHQIDFESKSVQLEYFQSKIKSTHECNYQPRSGQVQVKGYVDSLLDCNYGYYTNEYNGIQKTFFFWIVGKEFLARNTTLLTIQIDVFQTWLFDFNFTPCVIEREHVIDDNYGIHTIKEDFELGDYVTNTKRTVDCLTGGVAFFVAHTDISEDATMGGVFGATYSGCQLKYFDNDGDGINAMSDFISGLCKDGKGDAIAYIFQYPKSLISGYSSGDEIPGYTTVLNENIVVSRSDLMGEFPFDGKSYKPFNNKLYCYPYNFITVKNPSGGNVILKLENFNSSDHIDFVVESVLTKNPTITITPLDYSGKAFAIDDSISLSEYGLCSWNNDNYANWFAQHKNSINAQSANAESSMKSSNIVNSNNYDNALSNRDNQAKKGIINTAVGTANSLGSGNFFGAATGAIGGAANTYLDYQQSGINANNDLANGSLMNTTNYQNTIRSIVASVSDAKVQPNTCKGDTSACGLDVARNTATFFIEQVAIKPEYACIIDSYFQMFGYQVNALEVPKFKTREKWNYLKTVNCSVYGEIPQEDCNAINSMFNNGLTIWHGEPYMYNYNIENTIIGGES